MKHRQILAVSTFGNLSSICVHLWPCLFAVLARADLLAEAREATDYRALKLDPAAYTAQLMKPHMRLDAGGIGMGYAVDEALAVLKHEGIVSALVDASGDVGVSDPPPGERGWR